MKPFDLEAAQRGDPVQTRDGRPFVYGGYNPEADPYMQIVGWVDGHIVTRRVNGQRYLGLEGNGDLVMAPKKCREKVTLYWYHQAVASPGCRQ